jgi:hypothetical protein
VADVTLPANFTSSIGLLYSVQVAMMQGTHKTVSLGKLASDEFPELYLPDTNVLP